jgi:hypothetical protein
MDFAKMLRRLSRGGFGLLALLLAAAPALADVSVVIGYETRAVGEIEPCG